MRSPCSGWSRVAVRTSTCSPSSSASPAAIAPCIPSGYTPAQRARSLLVEVLAPHGDPHHSFTHTQTTSRRSTAHEPVAGPYRRLAWSDMAPWQACIRHTTSRGATWRARQRFGQAVNRPRRRASLTRVLLRRCAECARHGRARPAGDHAPRRRHGARDPDRGHHRDARTGPRARVRLGVPPRRRGCAGAGCASGWPSTRARAWDRSRSCRSASSTRSATAITACRSPAPGARSRSTPSWRRRSSRADRVRCFGRFADLSAEQSHAARYFRQRARSER